MRKLLLLALILITVSSVHAQKKWKNDTRHDLRFGVGAYPSFVVTFSDIFGYDSYYESIPSDTYRGAKYIIGSYSMSYTYRLTRMLELGGSISYAQEYCTIYDIITDDRVGKMKSNHLSFLPVLRLLCIQTKSFKLYAEASLGFEIRTKDIDKSRSNVSYQITPIGVAFGKKVFGFAEMGYGAQGIFRGGVGYRF